MLDLISEAQQQLNCFVVLNEFVVKVSPGGVLHFYFLFPGDLHRRKIAVFIIHQIPQKNPVLDHL